MRSLVLFAFALCLSAGAYATEYSVSGSLNLNPVGQSEAKPLRLPRPPAPVKKQKTVKPSDPSKFSGGIELGVGAFPGASNVSGMNEVGLVGDYKLDSHWGLEGRMAFSQFSLTNPYYYSGWNGWRGDWDDWYRYYYPSYAVYGGQTVNFSQVDLTFGPTYRFLTGRFSPVVGGLVGYIHRYYSAPTSVGYNYYQPGFSGSSDSLAVGALVGVDYKLTKELSIGADLRYMVPFAYGTNSGYYYPATSSPLESLNYYTTTVNLKFSF